MSKRVCKEKRIAGSHQLWAVRTQLGPVIFVRVTGSRLPMGHSRPFCSDSAHFSPPHPSGWLPSSLRLQAFPLPSDPSLSSSPVSGSLPWFSSVEGPWSFWTQSSPGHPCIRLLAPLSPLHHG